MGLVAHASWVKMLKAVECQEGGGVINVEREGEENDSKERKMIKVEEKKKMKG